MGCGIDVIYPPENRKLAEAIVEGGGAIISELPVGTPPIAENFPTRNRLISGLCLGVVIVEAAEKSGSLITARMALEQNRQVFAVPGSPLTGKTRGSNRLSEGRGAAGRLRRGCDRGTRAAARQRSAARRSSRELEVEA